MGSLSSALIAAGNDVLSNRGEGHFGSLAEVKNDILPCFFDSEYEPRDRHLSFVLTTVLEDILYNLTGDFPYNDTYGPQTHAKKKEFFEKVGRCLIGVGESLEQNDLPRMTSICEKLSCDYLDFIDEMNKVIGRG